MNVALLKKLVSRMNGNAFKRYVHTFFDLTYGNCKESICAPNECPSENLFRVLVDDANNPPTCSFRNFYEYVTYLYPLDLLADIKNVSIDSPELTTTLRLISGSYLQWDRDILPVRRNDGFRANGGEVLEHLYIITNFASINKKDYFKYFMPKVEKLMASLGFDSYVPGIGSIDSFCEGSPKEAVDAFHQFTSTWHDGISISVNSSGRCCINTFNCQKYFNNGLTRQGKFPVEPVFITENKNEIITELERLINVNAREQEIEQFIKRYYREVFGNEYDRIETQVWLKLKDVCDIKRDRRLDIFLRNTLLNDWELVELKRPINIISNYREVATFSSQVYKAIEQIRLYNRCLQKDSVKKYFAKEGIDYVVPDLKLVIGKKPQISPEDWRHLLKDNEKDVKILTYNSLVDAMKLRLEDSPGWNPGGH